MFRIFECVYLFVYIYMCICLNVYCVSAPVLRSYQGDHLIIIVLLDAFTVRSGNLLVFVAVITREGNHQPEDSYGDSYTTQVGVGFWQLPKASLVPVEAGVVMTVTAPTSEAGASRRMGWLKLSLSV